MGSWSDYILRMLGTTNCYERQGYLAKKIYKLYVCKIKYFLLARNKRNIM